MMIVSASLVSAQAFRIDSVTVDSIWNSDTNDNGLVMERRDMKVSFVPVGPDSATCFVDFSLDSCKRWICDREVINDIHDKGSFRAAPGQQKSVIMRMHMGDTPSVIVRVIARKDTLSIRRFVIGDQISGWKEDTSQPYSYYYFSNVRSLTFPIDGHYLPYSQNGFVDGFAQVLISQDSLHSITVMAYDFGLEGRASNMFGDMKRDWGGRITALPSYDSSIAIAKPALGGYLVAAHFSHFYVELNVSGFNASSSDSTTAKAEAVKFLDYYTVKASNP
jgi:hypothetical protein